MKYFSDQERGSMPRTKNEIPYNVWCGLVSYISTLVDTGCFGNNFPEQCPDGQGCCGTEEASFASALRAEILGIEWPLLTEKDEDTDSWMSEKVPFTPDYLDVLDLIQFCYSHASKPKQGQYHSYHGHHHITSFDDLTGKHEFLEKINTLFSRNGLAYELHEGGEITRVLNNSLNDIVGNTVTTADKELNEILVRSNNKITHPDVHVRYDALKELWDGLERIKTLFAPTDKKKISMTQLLNAVSSTPEFREELESEAKALTNIGNAFFIRHSEVSQVKLQDSDHIEYLFHRLASFLYLLAKKLG